MTRTTYFNVIQQAWMPRLLLAAAITVLAAVPSQAQDKDGKQNSDGTPATAQTHPESPMAWDTDAMMNQAVDQISRRYNLNDQQKEYTRLLLVSRVRAFLDQHEMEVRELLQESIDMRTGKRPSDAIALQVWANRALPLYQEASKAILDGNEEWAVILDDEQKEIHDRDMALMRRSFKNATETMGTWQEGKGKLPTVAQGKKPPQNVKTVNANESDKTVGAVSTDPRPSRVVKLEDNWLAYVNAFINTYALEGKDEVSARDKILKDMYAQARKYRELNKQQFEKLDKRQKNAAKDRTVRIHDVLKQKKQLELPIREMFVKLDKRLRRLPTAEQFANADADDKKKLEDYFTALAGDAAPGSRRKKPAAKAGASDAPKKDAGKGTESDKTEPSAEPSKKDGPAPTKEGKKPVDEKASDKPNAETGEKKAEPKADE